MNDLETVFFWISSIITVGSAIGVVAGRKLTYSVLLLAVSMVSLSGLFVLLQAHFLAMIQILIYAGAILVLFLVVIMLLGIGAESDPSDKASSSKALAFGGALLILALAVQLVLAILAAPAATSFPFSGTVEAIGEALFSEYLLPFELVSVILLVGIFGVVGLAHEKRKATRTQGNAS